MKKKSIQLYCFSPLVMALTFLFEVAAAGLALFKYKLNNSKAILIVLLLISLAGFQLAEFMVCGGWGFSGVSWARFGYVAITLLPPMGLHLAHKIAGKKIDWSVWGAYLTCAIYIAYYCFAVETVKAAVCRANYSVFNTPGVWAEFFAVYYYGWLIVAVAKISIWIKELSAQKTKEPKTIFAKIFSKKQFDDQDQKMKLEALKWLLAGYVSFMLPTTFVNIVNPATIEGIPSIMCGFAVILAMILIGFVAPRTLEKQ